MIRLNELKTNIMCDEKHLAIKKHIQNLDQAGLEIII